MSELQFRLVKSCLELKPDTLGHGQPAGSLLSSCRPRTDSHIPFARFAPALLHASPCLNLCSLAFAMDFSLSFTPLYCFSFCISSFCRSCFSPLFLSLAFLSFQTAKFWAKIAGRLLRSGYGHSPYLLVAGPRQPAPAQLCAVDFNSKRI